MYDLTFGVIFTVVMLLCSWRSYKIGRTDGADAIIEILHSKKIIAYDEKGDIKPNPWFEDDD